MRILLFILFISVQTTITAQSEQVTKVWYQDTSYLFLNNEKYNSWAIYRWKLKDQKLNGKFIVYYDKSLKDTAIMVNLINGSYEGLYREWDRENKYISHECFYENGYRKNKCYDYVYFFPEKGHDGIHKDSVQIEIYEYECFIEDGKDVQGEEVIKYKTIHRSEYEKATGVIRQKTTPVVKPVLPINSKDTIRRITPDIPNGTIIIDIKGRLKDVIIFGYYR